ncbi:MAG: hypothetical protein CL484_03150 [Acidobacteria bacterium]|nr:hypothetical protein [Acidobacteriota bacterium]
MPNFTPTAEQQAIIDAATSTKDNLLISALAGAAKTSTLELVAKALPDVNMVCLAFNKAIADEMKSRLPSNCTSMTLNSLGHRVWGQYLNIRRLNLYQGKMYKIVSDLVNDLPDSEKTEAFQDFAFILRSCNDAKGAGHLPDKFCANLQKPVDPLLNDAELIDSLEEKTERHIADLIIRALNISALQSMEGTIDFGDQVLFPSLFRCMYLIFSLILVDESQDLSPLNHRMLQQLYRRRIIAVGDQCQAIYGFRGAFEDGMEQMKVRFSMEELTLSTSFRCPEAIVNHVRWRAPHMQAWEGTPAGSVTTRPAWSLSEIPDGAAVICRNNAPLLSMAVNLLKHGRYPNLWGNDIAKGLIKKLDSLGPRAMAQPQALEALADYHAVQSKKVKNQNKLLDTIQCLEIFIREADTLNGAIQYAEHIFSSQGKIELMTGHKSKGHEFDHVYFLDKDLVGIEGQEPNLRYVIITRTKKTLTYIDSKGCLELEEHS